MSIIGNVAPCVSVLMSVYNEPEEWLCEAIDSILNQSFSDFEFIIINDNPRRVEHRQVLEDYRNKDSRIILINNLENIGLTKSLNIGLSIAKGRYIARMDADDISLPARFEKQVMVMENNPNLGIVGCWVRHFGKRDKVEKKFEYNEDIKEHMFFSSPFDHPATMMRNALLKKFCIKYDEKLRYAQDQKLWFELSKVSEFYNVPEVLFQHRSNYLQVSLLHREEQQRNIKLIRCEYIRYFFHEIGFGEIDYNKVSCHSISSLRKFRKQNILDKRNRRKISIIINVLFLSLDSYNLYTLLYYLFSMEYFNSAWSFRDFTRIVVKNLIPSKICRGGIRISNKK